MMRTLLIAAALALVSACVSAPPPEGEAEGPPEASIPFVDFGGIRSFRSGPNRTLLLEGTTGRWYQATFLGPCLDAPFAETIGVESDPLGRVDRFSAIIVRGRRCPFRSLIEISDPDAPAAEPQATQEEEQEQE